MVTQKEALNYYLELYKNKAIYVWGMNAPTIISKETIDAAYKHYNTAKYNRKYYDDKLVEGVGHVGSDCSGAHMGLSKRDGSAQDYFNRCIATGDMSTLPKDKVVLLFASKAKSTKQIDHTGVYLPGYGAFHMASSTRNSVLEDVTKRGWLAWGYADFISDYKIDMPKYDYKQWVADLQTTLRNQYNSKIAISGLPSVELVHELVAIGVLKRRCPHKKLVVLLQQFLNGWGRCNLVEDGIFGSLTLAAVKKFQKSNGLVDDGVVGQKTWTAICAIAKGC